MCRRAAWRGIPVELDAVSLGDKINFTDYDFIFLGGGADLEQGLVAADLQEKGPYLLEAVEKGVALLAICGGYQLLGKFYRTREGKEIPGAGLFDIYTAAGDERLKGNVLLKIPPQLLEAMGKASRRALIPETIVGYENHSGRTYLQGAKALGQIVHGKGNNGNDQTEGVCRNNAFGTYLHGPFLPRNPHFADLLLARALSRRWGDVELLPLDDSLEFSAHKAMRERLQ
jgi:hypothetical protein